MSKAPDPALSRLRSAAARLAPVAAFAGLVVVWESASRVFKIPSYLLPSPLMIAHGFVEQPVSVWIDNTWATMRVALMGYVAAIAISIPVAMLLAQSKSLSRIVYPMIIVVHSTPVVAIAPIIVVTMGASDLPRVVITFLITFFPIVVSTTTGILGTPPELLELSRSLRPDHAREMFNIRLPYASPHIFSALKVATTLSIVGAVVAEFVAAEKGLGYFIQMATSSFQLNQGFAGLVILVSCSLLFFQLIAFAQRAIAPWSLGKSER